MFLAIPLAVGLLVGKLTGGSFKTLAMTPLRGAWLFLLGFGIQLVLFTPLTDRQPWDLRYGSWLYVASLLLLLVGLLINIRRLRRPILILVVGAVLNFVVIVANGAAMPVQSSLLARWGGQGLVHRIENHTLATNVTIATRGTVLPILDDRWTIPGQSSNAPISIGDMFIALGGLLVVIVEMHRNRPNSAVLETETLQSRTSTIGRFRPEEI